MYRNRLRRRIASSRKGCRTHGFTLMELLLIIAIIAVLSAILFPVFNRAGEKKRAASCLSNQRQIGSSLLLYSQDYDETLPFYFYGKDADASTPVGSATVRYKWMDAVYSYLKDEKAFNCPGDSFPYTSRDGKNEVNNGYHFRSGTDYGSYRMNAWYRYDSGHRTPPCGDYLKGLKLKQIEAPATTIWIADGTMAPPDVPKAGTINAYFGFNCLKGSRPTLPCNPQPVVVLSTNVNPPQMDEIVARHQGMTNVIYCDGHAKAVSLETIAKPKTQGGTVLPDGTITAFTVEDD